MEMKLSSILFLPFIYSLHCSIWVDVSTINVESGNYFVDTIHHSLGLMECVEGLERCSAVRKLNMIDLLALDGIKKTPELNELLEGEGKVNGSICASIMDCSTLKAVSNSSCKKTDITCCCSIDDCAASYSYSFHSFISLIFVLLLIVCTQHII